MTEGYFSPSLFFRMAGGLIATSLVVIYYIARELGH